jgi:hypothetical protein
VQTELQATISRELGLSEVDGRKFIDIIPMLQRTLMQSFQNYRGNPCPVDTYQQGVQLGSEVGKIVELDENMVLVDAPGS